MAKILVTGASGFIGKRLIVQLLSKGHTVYALMRVRGRVIPKIEDPRLIFVYGDLKDLSKIDPLPSDLDAAYYLIHSMAEDEKDLIGQEALSAENFLEWLYSTRCQQIIYLSGIIEEKKRLSQHLASRFNVEKILSQAKIPLTVFRASIIIGAGSASFEIIRDLVEKLPLMVAPKWVTSLCQPIAVGDVLFYLSSALLEKALYGKMFEIGGPEVMTFKEVLLRYAKFRHLKRYILEVPVLTPRLSSYWLVLITQVRFSLCSYLVDSMKYNSICHDHSIKHFLPHDCLKFEEALKMAFLKIAQNEVISTWMDAWHLDEKNPDIKEFIELPEEGCLKDLKKEKLLISKEESIERIWTIGGKKGWYGLDWAWRLRGLIDQLLGGVGMNRGRRDPEEIEVGDSIDFWRVVKADRKKGHLILYAEMKLPGEAWVEFRIEKGFLYQTALFRPKGILGRIYWYSMWPFHCFIFRKMAKAIST